MPLTPVLPPASFSKVKELLERVLLNGQLEFQMTLSFIGIRRPEATAEAPTCAEFLAGTPIFSGEAAVVIGQQASMPTKSLN